MVRRVYHGWCVGWGAAGLEAAGGEATDVEKGGGADWIGTDDETAAGGGAGGFIRDNLQER